MSASTFWKFWGRGPIWIGLSFCSYICMCVCVCVCVCVHIWSSLVVHFSSVAQLCQTLCNPMNCSTPGFPVHHQLLEPTQTHFHHVGDAIQPSHPLPSPSPPAFNPSQHHSLFQWVSASHQVAGGSDRKEAACNARDLGLIPGLKDPLEKGMVIHSSIITWRIPWTEES